MLLGKYDDMCLGYGVLSVESNRSFILVQNLVTHGIAFDDLVVFAVQTLIHLNFDFLALHISIGAIKVLGFPLTNGECGPLLVELSEN
jgi:hypothetical protein